MSTRLRRAVNTVFMLAVVLLAYSLAFWPGSTSALVAMWFFAVLSAVAASAAYVDEEFHKKILNSYRQGRHIPLLFDLLFYSAVITLLILASQLTLATLWALGGTYDLFARKDAIGWSLLQ